MPTACRRWRPARTCRSARSRRPSISPSRRRAIRKPRWSSAWKSSASAGLRPTPRSCRCCATAAMCGSTRSASSPRTRAACWWRSWRTSSPDYVEYDFTASLEEQLDKISNNELPYKDVLRDFWKDFIGAVGNIKELRITQVIDALDEMLAPHLFPPKADGTDPRKCPNCENGRIGLKLGRFGGFVGCSNYPECKFTRQLTVGADGARRHAQARRGPRHRPRSHRALRPLRQLSAARRSHQGREGRGGEAQAREPAEGRRARRDRPRPRREAARPAPHHRQASGRRRGHHRRRRPLRPLRQARQDLRQHRQRRGHPHRSASIAR